MMFDEKPQASLPVERTGPSHSGKPQADRTAPVWRRRICTDDEEDTMELAPGRQGLIRRVRGDRRLPARRRLPANPFVVMEAEEGDSEESAAESESSQLAEPAQNSLTSTNTSNSDSDSDSDSESDSNSNSHSDSDFE